MLAPNLPGQNTEIMGAISLPRLAFTDNWGCAQAAFWQLKIPLMHGCGAYWSQSLCRMLEAAVAQDFKYVITLDYDTVFSAGHIVELIRLMNVTPDAAAIWATQVRQHDDVVLCGVYEEDGVTPKKITKEYFDGELSQATAGHFGLTIIRCDSLKKLSKPWMHGQPDKNGEWHKGKIDPDWSFWLNANKTGLKTYQANRVRIGHMQTVVTWAGDDFYPVHQYLMDWRENGHPEVVHPFPGASELRPLQTATGTYKAGRPPLRMDGERPIEQVVTDGKMRLNLGSSITFNIPGYTNIDHKTGGEVYPLDYPDNSVDVVRAAHILEHFNMREVPTILTEWLRVLKPGGVIKIAVPNFDYIISCYKEENGEPWPFYLFGGQEENDDFHKTPFTERDLSRLMAGLGVDKICRWTSECGDNASLDVSLNLQGVKTPRDPEKPTPPSPDEQTDPSSETDSSSKESDHPPTPAE